MKSFLLLCLVLSNLQNSISANSGQMFGEYEETEIIDCKKVYNMVRQDMDQIFKDHEIVFCWKQIVDGFNYKMILVNEKSDIPDCDIVVWHDFREVKYRLKKRRAMHIDCYTKLDYLNDKREADIPHQDL